MVSGLVTAIAVTAVPVSVSVLGALAITAVGVAVGKGADYIWDKHISKSSFGSVMANLINAYGYSNNSNVYIVNNSDKANPAFFDKPVTLANMSMSAGSAFGMLLSLANGGSNSPSGILPFLEKSAYYTLKPGESFSDIAKRLNIPLEDLLKLNPLIKNPDDLKPGNSLLVPVPGSASGNSEFFKFLNNLLWSGAATPNTSNAYQNSRLPMDPIAIDLNGDGVKTIAKSAGLVFDHDGNLFAENTGWISPGDGLLVLDKNHDGKINLGNELFGNNTIKRDGTLAKTGYDALQDYDDNHDGIIDKNDSIWSQLQIWQDKNSNAVAEDGELLSLDQLNITGIKLNYKNINQKDSEGNIHVHQGEMIYADGHTSIVEDLALDVNKGKTKYTGDTRISNDAASLPYVNGFGNMPDLQELIELTCITSVIWDSPLRIYFPVGEF